MPPISEEEVERKLIECENKVARQIAELADKVDAHEISLKEAEKKRLEMSDTLDDISHRINNNHKDEKARYMELLSQLKKVTKAIDNLAEATATNSNYIAIQKYNDEIDDEIEKRRREEQEELENSLIGKVRSKVIIAVATVVALAVTSGLGTILYYGFKAYMKLQLGD